MLEYFGDIGGLFDFLFYAFGFAILPLTAFKLNGTLLQELFDERTYKPDENSHDVLSDRIKQEFRSFESIQLGEEKNKDKKLDDEKNKEKKSGSVRGWQVLVLNYYCCCRFANRRSR